MPGQVYFDDTGKIRKVYADPEFIETNLELARLKAEQNAKANKQAQMQETRKILTFYNALQKEKQQSPNQQQQQQQQPQQGQGQNPPRPLPSLERSQQQQQPQTLQSNNNNNAVNASNVLRQLELMRRIANY
jgi:hypothetical protein